MNKKAGTIIIIILAMALIFVLFEGNQKNPLGDTPSTKVYNLQKQFSISTTSLDETSNIGECKLEMLRQGHEETHCYIMTSVSRCYGTLNCDSFEVVCSCKY